MSCQEAVADHDVSSLFQGQKTAIRGTMVEFTFDVVGYALDSDAGSLYSYSAALVGVLGRGLISDGGKNTTLYCQKFFINRASYHSGDLVVIPDKRS